VGGCVKGCFRVTREGILKVGPFVREAGKNRSRDRKGIFPGGEYRAGRGQFRKMAWTGGWAKCGTEFAGKTDAARKSLL